MKADIAKAQDYVRGTIICMVRPEDVDDVLQDAALSAWRARKQFCGRSRYETWFFRIAVRAALMHLRKRTAEQLPEEYEALDERAKTPERLAEEAERDARLYRAILELSPKRRSAAVRCLREEKTGSSADKAARHKMRECLREVLDV